MSFSQVEYTTSSADQVLAKYPNAQDHLIALLQELQELYGYLPEDVLRYVSRKAEIPLATLSGVVTFYAQFRLHPPGQYQIFVCAGTACHVNGAETVAETVASILGVGEGETTPDGLFSWETAACLGCCSLSPVMMVNGHVYGKLTTDEINRIFEQIRTSHQGGA